MAERRDCSGHRLKPAVSVAILGAGARGQTFAGLVAERADRAHVVAVAEPRPAARAAMAARYGLDGGSTFASWQDFVAQPRMCDAVVVTTMDRDHAGPAIACLERGYHLLLEKPMATTLEECRAIADAARRSQGIASVCHSLRYHRGFARVKELVEDGRIGKILSVDQLEQVGYWHYAHSYVRGNWGNEGRATFMLLAKSCHDIDYISFLVGRACSEVASFGALSHLRRENAPVGSTDRCTDGCAVESSCIFSAPRLYDGGPLESWLRDPEHGGAVPKGRAARVALLRQSPYGRCVWRADNDVVDHQVVLMNFEGGVTATFTMAGLTDKLARRVRVHGTEGELEFEESAQPDGDRIVLRRFGGAIEELGVPAESGTHGGADRRVVERWLEAINAGDPSLVLTSVAESLRTHTIVFAAEAARLRKSVEKLADWQLV